jgi:thiol-disulfide isomerase/thioredoxin
VTAIARSTSLALLSLSLALAGIGCGQQDEPHTNTGPVTDANSTDPTPSTATSAAPTSTPAPAPAPMIAADNKSEVAPGSTSAAEPEVVLEKVTYDAFLRRIAENPAKPRYTIVDTWATWCGPCKENFPHVVQMHEKFAPQGLAVVSMSFDDPSEPKQIEDARAFLREKKAKFTNFVLDEAEGVGFEKFGINSIPAVFVYGPDGKEVKRFTWDDTKNQFTYEDVEKAVAALLEGKAPAGE